MPDELHTVFAEFDARAAHEPRLEQFRVPPGGPTALAWVPDGWFVSEAIQVLAVEGGWWPGSWMPFPDDGGHDESLPDLLCSDEPAPDELARRQVQWMLVGSVWERDFFYTPLMRRPAPSAPVMGFSSQALWFSLVFPPPI